MAHDPVEITQSPVTVTVVEDGLTVEITNVQTASVNVTEEPPIIVTVEAQPDLVDVFIDGPPARRDRPARLARRDRRVMRATQGPQEPPARQGPRARPARREPQGTTVRASRPLVDG